MLSLQTSNDDLCWLVGLCPRTESGIQGQSVPGQGGGNPAAPAAWPCRGLSPLCHSPGNKGDCWPPKYSDTRHRDTWDCPSCCLPYRWLKGREAQPMETQPQASLLHCLKWDRSFYPRKIAPVCHLLVLSPKNYIYTARLVFPLFLPFSHLIIPWLILSPKPILPILHACCFSPQESSK